MKEIKKGCHWLLSNDSNQVYWLSLDRPDHPLNTLHSSVMEELNSFLACIEKSDARALLIVSGKANGFMAGADLRELQSFQTQEQMQSFIDLGQDALQRLSDLSIPSIALIHGACLGGGYELALACDYRVATPDALIGLPEVHLGLIPGWGGSVRLMRLLGALRAMPLLVLGRRLSAEKALMKGLIDYAVEKKNWSRVVDFLMVKKPKPKKASLMAGLASAWWARPLWVRLMKKRLESKGLLGDKDPAPYAILTNWLSAGVSSQGFQKEASAVSRLLFTRQCQDHLKVFFNDKNS